MDPQRFDGSCYRAANWRRIGQTKGRNEVAEENWAKVIKRKLAEIDVDVDGEKNVDLDENSEKYAQRLLKTPLGDMLDILHGQFNA